MIGKLQLYSRIFDNYFSYINHILIEGRPEGIEGDRGWDCPQKSEVDDLRVVIKKLVARRV